MRMQILVVMVLAILSMNIAGNPQPKDLVDTEASNISSNELTEANNLVDLAEKALERGDYSNATEYVLKAKLIYAKLDDGEGIQKINGLSEEILFGNSKRKIEGTTTTILLYDDNQSDSVLIIRFIGIMIIFTGITMYFFSKKK